MLREEDMSSRSDRTEEVSALRTKIMIRTKCKEWKWDESKAELSNPSIGSIRLVDVVNRNTGEALYDQPIWSEKRGEVLVVVHEITKCIAFVLAERHAPICIPDLDGAWKTSPGIAPNPLSLRTGIIQLELPRGWTENLAIEAEEEVQLSVKSAYPIGRANGNTAFWATSPIVAAVRVGTDKSARGLEPRERIIGVRWLELENAFNVDTICALTAKGLLDFRKWCIECYRGRHPVPDHDFWGDIGRKLSAKAPYKVL